MQQLVLSVQQELAGSINIRERKGRGTEYSKCGGESEKRSGKAVFVYMDKREIWSHEITYS